MKPLYVYALVPHAPDAAGLGEGLAGEELRVVPLGSAVAAVVGEMEDRPSIAPASLRSHDAVVRRIGRRTDAILPLRFGAMVLSAAELEEGLSPRLGALAEALDRTRGCDQMTLRLYLAGEPVPRRGEVVPLPAAPDLRDGTRRVRRPELAPVRDALAPIVRSEVDDGDSVFHLIERARAAEYRARVEAAGPAVAPARLVVTGPWPPYAFTVLE